MKKEKAKRKTSARLSPAKGKAAKHDDFLTDRANQSHLVRCAGTTVTRILAVLYTGSK